MLHKNLSEFDVTSLSERLDQIHGIEHAADQKKHENAGSAGKGVYYAH